MVPRSPLLHALLLLALVVAGVASLQAAPRATARLRDITVSPGERRALITLLFDRRVGTVVVEPRAGNAQVRLRPVGADRAALASARLRSGVRSVRARIERRDVLVVDVDFARRVTSMSVVRRNGDSVVIAVALAASGGDRATEDAPRETVGRSKGDRKRPRQSGRWALSTIVIDAGHGGKDPGAIGLGDVQEKEITLAVARQLRKELERSMPGVRVVMTRSGDEFVELYRRGQLANEKSGRLFISIHCNSLPDTVRSVSGFECFILKPEKSGDAARVAAAENDAIRFETDRAKYDAMSAESAIVASMAQSAFARYSEQAAQSIRTAMRTGTKLLDRGVHQAGFFVLVGAAMPAVLVEIGYLSSPTDMKTLTSTSGRRSIARAIANGIVRYEKTYSASLKQ
jgi:N-acetylmuramoyl-L-alanine amidase